MEKRRNFTPEQKAKIVIETLREERTLSEIAAEHEIHPNMLSRWKAEFLSYAGRVYSKETDELAKAKQSYEKEKDELLRQVLEGFNCEKLYQAYSSTGRKPAVEPKILFKVLTYAYTNNIYSSRKIENACRRDINFMWLLEGNQSPDTVPLPDSVKNI